MQQIISFIYKNSIQILFLLLLGLSLAFTIQAHSYHRSRAISSANAVTGYVYEKINNVEEYFSLRKENEKLADENARLKNMLYNSRDSLAGKDMAIDTINGNYRVITAKVISNSYSRHENYLTINKGTNDSIQADMGVVNSKGVIGFVEKTSKHYATVISILNLKFSLDAKIKNSNHFGTIKWDGKNAGYVQLTDVPRLASVKPGDTIVTGGRTTTFPDNTPIGKIEKIYKDKRTNNFTLSVRLFNDMTSLGYVYVIENRDSKEISEIQETTGDDE